MAPGSGMARVAGTASDLDIQEWIQENYGFVPHPFWIAHCRELYLSLAPVDSEPRPSWHQCPTNKILPIRQALEHFGLLK